MSLSLDFVFYFIIRIIFRGIPQVFILLYCQQMSAITFSPETHVDIDDVFGLLQLLLPTSH